MKNKGLFLQLQNDQVHKFLKVPKSSLVVIYHRSVSLRLHAAKLDMKKHPAKVIGAAVLGLSSRLVLTCMHCPVNEALAMDSH